MTFSIEVLPAPFGPMMARISPFLMSKETSRIAFTPPNESDNAAGGTTESGISDNHGLVFTGTPTAAGLDKRVSVSVDLSITGADHTDLVFAATEVLTGPGTAEEPVPDDKKAAVFRAFSTTMPGMKLPFGLAPTSEGARGSDVIIEGIASGVTVPLDGFRQS